MNYENILILTSLLIKPFSPKTNTLKKPNTFNLTIDKYAYLN